MADDSDRSCSEEVDRNEASGGFQRRVLRSDSARARETLSSSEDEQQEEKGDTDEEDDTSDVKKCELECAVCLQNCVHPAQLPCGHIFCFLCLKGIAYGSKRCAMCRDPIPSGYLDNPVLLHDPQDEHPPPPESYQWYYEGRNGWWQYDRRACAELESAYRDQVGECELLIGGHLYRVDMEGMLQYRSSEPARRRRVKRDKQDCPKKGVAGIRAAAEIVEDINKLNIS